MVHKNGDNTKDRQDSTVVTLSVSDVMALEDSICPFSAEDRQRMALSAMESYGLCGMGTRQGESWIEVILVSPSQGVPTSHPLSAFGIDQSTAALLVVFGESSLSLSKKIYVGLCRRLKGQIEGIEAQSGHTSVLTPSSQWLIALGFQPLRYPVGRYRLSFSSLASWVDDQLARLRRPRVTLSEQPTSRSTS